jgi:NAD(P)-dependent dehydrogenase (short-subunit alcohol dehydrogenase family)
MSGAGALDGRVVAVAGAGGGLGPVVVRALADAGAAVAAADRSGDALEGLDVDCSAVDLLAGDGAEAWAAHVQERFGGCDALLHLVGGWKGGKLEEFPLADAELLHDLLVRTVIHASRAFLPALKASGRGRFLLVSSPQADRPSADNAAYGAYKAAAEAWALAVADELDGHGGSANIVRVNAILTPAMRAANPDKPDDTFTPAEDIAAALVWLLSPAAAKMKGQRLALHG